MKKGYLLMIIVVLLSLSLGLTSCLTTNPEETDVTPEFSVVSNIDNGTIIVPKSLVTFQLKDEDGKTVPSELKLYKDGNLLKTYDAESDHIITVDSEGSYSVELKPTNYDVVKKYNFKATNLEKEIYNDGGTWYIEKFPENISNQATNILIRFYKYKSVPIEGTSEVVDKRVRLKGVDSDGNGFIDTWEEVETGDEQGWIQIPISYFDEFYATTWIGYKLIYTENFIMVKLLGIDGTYKGYVLSYTFAEKGFELNNYYSRYLLTADNKEYSYEQFLLRERYNSDNKPEFKLEQLSTTATTTEDFKVNIVAKNVADFAKLYDVRFMKLGLNFEGLKLKDVVFSDFMDGLKDVSTYTYTPDSTTAILYKGLVLEGDETEEATENFATLVFEVTNTESATVTLSYEGWWDSYEAYPDTPNPVFKDKYNANVDGFVIDHTPLSVVVGGEE